MTAEEQGVVDRLLSVCPGSVLEREFKLNRVHGDFIPWNLKVSSDEGNPLSVIDWEYFRSRGFPLSDFAFFTWFTQDFLSPDSLPSNAEFLECLKEPTIRKFAIEAGMKTQDLVWGLIAALLENAYARRQAGHSEANGVVVGLLRRASTLMEHIVREAGRLVV